MGALDFVGNNSSSGGMVGALIRLILRFFQFVLAITVAALYGIDLHRAREAGAYTDGKWVYAEVVAGLSAVTVLIMAFRSSSRTGPSPGTGFFGKPTSHPHLPRISACANFHERSLLTQ